MQTFWKVNGHSKLLLLFSGWAMDENPTAYLVSEDRDFCTCFDYANLETTDIDRWKKYQDITLIAWSTGVWAAEQVLGKLKLPITIAVAINGTPTTIHEQTGISRAIFQGTYDQLSAQTMQKFQRRMTGSLTAYNAFLPFAPKRNLENQKKESKKILEVEFETLETGLINWDKAIIGKSDAIFLPQNQLRYWTKRTETLEVEMPHYPFFHIRNL
jgi:biotin synthesis protein BioG